MKRIITGLLMLISPVLFNSLSAHGGHGINTEQKEQHAKIKHGRATGQLTPKEAMALHMQQAKIENYKEMAKADGKITRPERKLIKHEQKKAERNIYRQKHDCQHKH